MPKRGRGAFSGRGGKRRRVASRLAVSARRRRPRMNAKVMLKMARRAVLKSCETKYVSASAENVNLAHNGGPGPIFTYVQVTNMLGTTIGNTQATRVGDEVYGVGLSIRLWLSNKLDRPNVMYRIMVIATPVGDVTATSLFKGAVGNKMLDYVDTDRYNVVYHKILQPPPGDYSLETGAANKERSRMHKIWIPTKGKISYLTDGGAVTKYQKNCLSLVVIAYDAFGTLPTDNIASFGLTYRFYFKDP